MEILYRATLGIISIVHVIASHNLTEQVVRLNRNHTIVNVLVPVVNDDTFEPTESLLAQLSFSGNAVPRVVLRPSTSNVTIFDDDCKSEML